jgi:type IV pilus assembly protein PilV
MYCSRIERARGSSLVEIMISLFVLVTALLGFAALQLNSMQSLSKSRFHARAVQVAATVAEAIRANSDAARNGSYDGHLGGKTSPVDCHSRACSPSELVDYDKASWSDLLSVLPEGRGSINRRSIPDGESIRLTLCWRTRKREKAGSCGSMKPDSSGPGVYQLQLLL